MVVAKLTQFLLPDGRKKPVECDVPDDLAPQLDAMKNAGAELEAEVLRGGTVSLTVVHEEHGDFDGEVTPNGPDVPKALERLIRRFDRHDFNRWLSKAEQEVDDEA